MFALAVGLLAQTKPPVAAKATGAAAAAPSVAMWAYVHMPAADPAAPWFLGWRWVVLDDPLLLSLDPSGIAHLGVSRAMLLANCVLAPDNTSIKCSDSTGFGVTMPAHQPAAALMRSHPPAVTAPPHP